MCIPINKIMNHVRQKELLTTTANPVVLDVVHKSNDMETIKIKDLKKGMRILFHNQVYVITSDAKNFGNRFTGNGEITNTDWDTWGAGCEIETKCNDSLLDNFDWFQGNGHARKLLLLK